jgi:hypothetical protein
VKAGHVRWDKKLTLRQARTRSALAPATDINCANSASGTAAIKAEKGHSDDLEVLQRKDDRRRRDQMAAR